MEIVFTKQAIKDFEKIKTNQGLYKKVIALLELIEIDPFSTPPTHEKLIGIESTYSRRTNIHHRLVYQVYQEEQTIKIIRLWTHYDNIGKLNFEVQHRP